MATPSRPLIAFCLPLHRTINTQNKKKLFFGACEENSRLVLHSFLDFEMSNALDSRICKELCFAIENF
jgi:hypothetical protein